MLETDRTTFFLSAYIISLSFSSSTSTFSFVHLTLTLTPHYSTLLSFTTDATVTSSHVLLRSQMWIIPHSQRHNKWTTLCSSTLWPCSRRCSQAIIWASPLIVSPWGDARQVNSKRKGSPDFVKGHGNVNERPDLIWPTGGFFLFFVVTVFSSIKGIYEGLISKRDSLTRFCLSWNEELLRRSLTPCFVARLFLSFEKIRYRRSPFIIQRRQGVPKTMARRGFCPSIFIELWRIVWCLSRFLFSSQLRPHFYVQKRHSPPSASWRHA